MLRQIAMSTDTPPRANTTPPIGGGPLISVIIACKDPGPGLKETLANIWAQIALPPELIVVDGGSEDGSRVWLASQKARLGTLIMDNDNNVFEALNKGLAVARGEWVLFLGANDKFYHDAVLSRAQPALKASTAGVVVGEVAYEDGVGLRLPAKLDPLRGNFVHRPGAFYRRSLFAEHGNFDATLALQADYDFNIRLFKKGVKFEALPLRLTTCKTGSTGHWPYAREEITVRHRHFPSWQCWIPDISSVLGGSRNQGRRKGAAKPA